MILSRDFFSPLSETGLPFSKPMTTSVATSGACCESTVIVQMSAGGSFQGFSSTPHSIARPNRLSSIE